jgi:L-amino acid N-acyltransferase YncA
MRLLIEDAKAKNYHLMIGQIFSDNVRMLEVAKELGFTKKHNSEDHQTIDVELKL